jgi:hypothetical protein
MKRHWIQLIVILLFGKNGITQITEYPWMTSRSDILADHHLTPVPFQPIFENLKKYSRNKEYKNVRFYIMDSLKTVDYCGIGFYSIYGFYRDSLFIVMHGNYERPYVEKDPADSCISSAFFWNDSTDSWMIIFKESEDDGNIFREGGFLGHYAGGDHYADKLISVGIVTHPSHRQYCYIFTSRIFIDRLNQSMKIHPDNFKRLYPTVLFTRSISGKYNIYKEKMEAPSQP